MFIITEKVVSLDEIIGYGGYAINKKLTGNIIQSDKVFINLRTAKKLAKYMFLGCHISMYGKKGIGRFDNYGVVGLDENGDLNLAYDLTYMKRCLLGYTESFEDKKVEDLLPETTIEKVENCVLDISVFEEKYGLTTCRDKGLRNFLYKVNISVLHMCISILKENGYEVDKESLLLGELAGYIRVNAKNETKAYKSFLIENRMLKVYSEIYTLVGIKQDGKDEELLSTCDLNNLALAIKNYSTLTV